MENVEDDLSMQLGWNQLFQHFVSDLFSDGGEEKNAPVVTIDELQANGRGIGQTLTTLRNAIDFVRNKYAQNFTPAQLPETNHLSVLAEGLSLYFKSALSTPQYCALSEQLSAASEHWLLSFMNLQSNNIRGIFQKNEKQARIFACRVALHTLFPNYAEQGYLAIDKQPIVYYSSSILENQENSFHTLGLPRSSFVYVKDLNHLEELIPTHTQQNKVPLILLVSAFSFDLLALDAIRTKYNLFVHIEGDDLALLSSKAVKPSSFSVIKNFDSFSISPGDWYGLATPSTCTFLTNGVPAGIQLEAEDMLALPLWLTMQYVGRDKLIDIITTASGLAKEMSELLEKIPSIIKYSSHDSLSVVFRYFPKTKTAQEFHLDFLNSLNSQVLIDLSETALPLGLDMHYVQKYNCLRFRPLTLPDLMRIDGTDIRVFVDRLKKAIECINATLSCAPDFEEVIQTCKGLQCVFVRNFVGIGAVRYLPTFLRGVNLADEVSAEVDNVNSFLAKELATIDSLFSEGTTTEGKTCVCLGVETKPINNSSPSHYAKIIMDTVEKHHLHEKIEEKFSGILRQGIVTAEKYLKIESEFAEQQQGLMRSIPVVSSVLNWWSPAPKAAPVGKSFDIGSTSLRNVVFSPKKPDGSTPTPSPRQPGTPSAAPTGTPSAAPTGTPSAPASRTPSGSGEKPQPTSDSPVAPAVIPFNIDAAEEIPKPEPLPDV